MVVDARGARGEREGRGVSRDDEVEPRHNLPNPLTTFVGREAELSAVEPLMSERRLVCLTGVGGCGKTRLAVRLATRLTRKWPDGVWFVDLAAVTDPALVPRHVASALGVLPEPADDQVPALAAQLRGRRMLVLLDTCEHLLEPVSTLTDALLRGCPGVSVLATSREPLGVEGETVWRVPSLEPPEAVQLFADRAGLVRPRFDVDAARAEAAAICARVDGIPLAVELAAAWMRALSPAQIAAGLDDCFRLLAGGPRRAIPRHQTLRASMVWSHALLAEDEKVMFRRLAVFAGTFTLQAARDVCAEDICDPVSDPGALQLMGRLLDKSLVTARESRGETRYHLLDTIRQYAEEQLQAAGEAEATRDRHLGHFLALAEEAEPGLDLDQDTWRAVLDSHHDNINAALHWGLSAPGERADPGRRLAAAMARQWLIRGQAGEGLGFLTRAVELCAADRSALQGRLWAGISLLAMVSGRKRLVAEAAGRGLDIALDAGDQVTRARCLAMAAYPHFFRDFVRCQAMALEAQAAAREAGDPFALDWAAAIEGYSLETRNRYADAVPIARAVFERSWSRRDRFCAVFALGIEMWLDMLTGDLRRAVALGAEMVRIVAPLGDYFAVGTNSLNVAYARALAGDLGGARRLTEPIVRSLDAAPEADVVGFMVTCGLIDLRDGDLEGAVRWFQRGVQPDPGPDMDWTGARCLPGLAGALRRLGRTEEAAHYATLGVQVATRFGGPYELANLLDEQAFLARTSDPDRARDGHHQALAVRIAIGLRPSMADSLDAFARLELDAGRPAEAVRLLATSDAAREDMGYPRPPVDRADHEAVLAALRASLGADELAALWAEGAARSLDDAVSVLTRGRGPRGRPQAGWESLTPTEVEVARLVGDGLSNPDIAARRYMSRSTVKAHLSHIYAKLGVTNRTQLATLLSTKLSADRQAAD